MARSTHQLEARTLSAAVTIAASLIHERYPEPLTTARIAVDVGISRSHLCTLFRRETGRSLHDYLNAVRIEAAQPMIVAGDKIEAIALSVGFASPRTFYRQYHARFGRNPRERTRQR